MKAYIEGIEAMKEIDPAVRILITEPLVNVVAPHGCTPEMSMKAAAIHNDQFQVLDILSGAICPELKGRPEYLDIIGCNYYFNNQWIVDQTGILQWWNKDNDCRFVPLSKLIADLYQRYGKPIVLSETSHPKEDRPKWVSMIAEETIKILHQNIPFWGICWYPVIDRPDWDNLTDWHQSGLWDAGTDTANPARHLHLETAESFLMAQNNIRQVMHPVTI